MDGWMDVDRRMTTETERELQTTTMAEPRRRDAAPTIPAFEIAEAA